MQSIDSNRLGKVGWPTFNNDSFWYIMLNNKFNLIKNGCNDNGNLKKKM